jgi:Ribbon-helix-helix protein, copG family
MEEAEATSDLEPLDIEVRSPTIVLSVRLDDATARRLRVLAHQRGMRISDLLREAASSLAEGATGKSSPVPMPYDIAYLDTAVGVGITTPRTVVEVKGYSVQGPWSSVPMTSVSVRG